jgi:hypothetical protein
MDGETLAFVPPADRASYPPFESSGTDRSETDDGTAERKLTDSQNR